MTPTNLELVKTHVIRCAQCKRWICRLPQWYNADVGHRHYCQYCLCTSIIISDGRPVGPRSRHWQSLVDEFNELLPIWTDNEMEAEWFLSTVEMSK
jgi:hypothetical protein